MSLPSSAEGADVVHPEVLEAFLAAKRGDMETARTTSKRAVELYPTSAIAWKVRGFTLSRSSLFTAAIAAYQRAVRLQPGDAVSHNNLGAARLKAGRLREAVVDFDTALRLSPAYADARNNRGVCLERMGSLASAEQAYRIAVSSNPNHPEAHNNLGAVLLRQGQVAEAAAEFDRALAIQPQFAAPALNLVLAHVSREGSMSDEQLAELTARSGNSASARAQVLAMRASSIAQSKRYREALPLFEEASKLDPTNAGILNNLAVVEDQLGMDREALMHLSRAMELDPNLRVAQNNVGIVHVHRGDHERAMHVFQSLLRDDPLFHRAHYNLGVIYSARGNVIEARRSFARASQLRPTDADTIYNLALLAREQGGDPASERQGYERALRLDPSMHEAHLALGTLLADPETPPSLRDPNRATHHLRRFLALALPSDRDGRAQANAWLQWLGQRRGR